MLKGYVTTVHNDWTTTSSRTRLGSGASSFKDLQRIGVNVLTNCRSRWAGSVGFSCQLSFGGFSCCGQVRIFRDRRLRFMPKRQLDCHFNFFILVRVQVWSIACRIISVITERPVGATASSLSGRNSVGLAMPLVVGKNPVQSCDVIRQLAV